MDINDFKRHCAEQKLKEEEFRVKHNLLTEQQKQYSNTCYKPKYSWFFSIPYCPCCGKRLVETNVYSSYILYCDCGFEYADNYSVD